uniref:Uncharacterized protein n=1 Tax=Hucho hucho TaxID=62062 RepID=A0A4W5QVJ7_9TELE
CSGQLVKMLVYTEVTRHRDFKELEESYVYSPQISHCGCNMVCVSDLMGLFDKHRFRKLLLFILNFEEGDLRTHQDMDPNRTGMRELFMEFLGHVLALYCSDDYLERLCIQTIRRLKLYSESMAHQ